MNNIIKFSVESEDLLEAFPHPVPSHKLFPDYFKKLAPRIEGAEHTQASFTSKQCVPMKDAMRNGFIIPMWTDVMIKAKNGKLRIEFPELLPLQESLGGHDYRQAPNHPYAHLPYGQTLLKWSNPWIVETKKGYSCLFTSPLNHLEGRFKLFDGVVDTDTYYTHVNFPFIFTGGDGEYLIEKGTPLVQVIPFKREKYSVKCEVTDAKKLKKANTKLATRLYDGYKKIFWHGLNKKG